MAKRMKNAVRELAVKAFLYNMLVRV